MSVTSSEDLGSVVVFGVEDAHESQAGSAVELAGVEEHRGTVTWPFSCSSSEKVR